MTAIVAGCSLGSLLKGDVDRASLGHVSVEGFWAIWRGESPPVSGLFDREVADDVLPRLLETGRIEVDNEQRLRGIHGVTLEATPHQIRHGGSHVHTWCALDAIGIPAALGMDAEATTSCPRCGRPLRMRIVEGAPDGEATVRLWLPDACGTHLQYDFCRHANLFCSLDHLKRHRRTGGRVITIDEAAELGPAIWADVVARGASGHHGAGTSSASL